MNKTNNLTNLSKSSNESSATIKFNSEIIGVSSSRISKFDENNKITLSNISYLNLLFYNFGNIK